MSLNQKYTWNEFLKENPEMKAKNIKRTSSEGKKAFDTAFKLKVKDVIKSRFSWIDKEITRMGEKRSILTDAVKAANKPVNRRKIQLKVGAADKYIHRLGKMTDRAKQVQKNI